MLIFPALTKITGVDMLGNKYS